MGGRGAAQAAGGAGAAWMRTGVRRAGAGTGRGARLTRLRAA